MPYVPAWERLPDVIGRLMAGGGPKELAQADLCRAIADGTVNIRCQLKERRGSRSTSKASLEGKAFEIPTEINPDDFEWELSRPLNPWFVRRECYSSPGHWHLALIEVCRADVSKALCIATEQGENTQQAASRPALDRPRRPNVAGLGRRRGAQPRKFEQTKEAMRKDIQAGRLALAELENMLEKNLEARYDVSRDTARRARKAVLSEFNSGQISTNDK